MVNISVYQQQDLQGAELKHEHLQIIIDLNGLNTYTHAQAQRNGF